MKVRTGEVWGALAENWRPLTIEWDVTTGAFVKWRGLGWGGVSKDKAKLESWKR